MDSGILLLGGMILVSAIFFVIGIKVVPPGFAGVVIVFGQPQQNVGPGWHWIPPLVSRIDIIETRGRRVDPSLGQVMTKDGFPLGVDAFAVVSVSDPTKAQFEIRPKEVEAFVANSIRQALTDLIRSRTASQIRRDPAFIVDVQQSLREVLEPVEERFGYQAIAGIEAFRFGEELERAYGSVKRARLEATATKIEKRAQGGEWLANNTLQTWERMAQLGQAPLIVTSGGVDPQQVAILKLLRDINNNLKPNP